MKKFLTVLMCFMASVMFVDAQNVAVSFGKKPMNPNQRARVLTQPQTNPLQMRGNTAYGVWSYTGIGTANNYYSFDVDVPTTVTQICAMSNIFSGEYYNNNFYAFDNQNNFYVFNATTGAQISTAVSTAYPNELAFDYSSNVMYGVKGTNLWTVNLTTGALTQVATLTQSMLALAVDVDGNMYGISSGTTTASLYSINKSSGACTLIGTNTGYEANYVQSMGFDYNTGTLYWCQCDNTSEAFCTVSTTTGVATAVVASGFGEVCGFYVPYVANQNLANAPSNFTVTPDANQGLTAVLSWTNPTTSLNGNALTAISKVMIIRDGAVIDSITPTTVGASLTYNDTLPTAASYNYSVYAVTSEGNGLTVSSAAIVGPMCSFTVEMNDEYGDGWNGASLSIQKTDGTVITSLSLSEESATAMVLAPIDTVVCVWVSGSYDDECSFTIKDNYSITLFASDTSLAAGEVCRFYNGCLPPEFANVTGTVNMLSNGDVIANAVIAFAGPTTEIDTTDANGAYNVTLYQGFSYDISIVAAGYNDYAQAAYMVPDSDNLTLNYTMTAPCISVSPTSVSASCNYASQATAQLFVTNCGNGPLTWTANALYTPAETPAAMPQGISWSEYVEMAGTMNEDNAPISFGRAPATTPALVYNAKSAKHVTSAAICALAGAELNHFTLNDAAHLTSYNVTATEFTNAATYDGTNYYYASSTSGNFGTIDPTTGAMTQIATGNHSGAVAYNPVNSTLYGMSLGANAVVYTINPTTGAEAPAFVCHSSDVLLSLAISNDGRFFVIDATADNISELNPNTGELTVAWDCGFSVNYGQDMDFDRENNILYWAAFNVDADAAQLWAVDVNAGTGSLLATFEDQVSCFATRTNAGWLSFQPAFGVLEAGVTDTVTVKMNGWHAPSGTFYATADFTSANPNVGNATSDITFTINPSTCSTPSNLQAQCVNHDYIALTWDAPADTVNLTGYYVFRNGYQMPMTTTTAAAYEDHAAEIAATYCYQVAAVYADGCVSVPTAETCAAKTYCDSADMCEITVTVQSNGQGWIDSELDIYNGERLETTLTCDAASDTYTFTTCQGALNFEWTAGAWDSAFGIRCGFTVKDAFGVTVFTAALGSLTADGHVFTLQNACSDHTGIVNHTEASFGLYPNPANNVLNITTHTNYNKVEILNYLGQVVYAEQIHDANFQIGISQLNNGIYFVRLSGNEGTMTKKFIKQ